MGVAIVIPVKYNVYPISYLFWATFRPTKFKFHYVAPQFFIFQPAV